LDTLHVALLIYFVVGLVAIPILYRLFGREAAESNRNQVRKDKGVNSERRGETSAPD
jgi:hypothetical protein